MLGSADGYAERFVALGLRNSLDSIIGDHSESSAHVYDDHGVSQCQPLKFAASDT